LSRRTRGKINSCPVSWSGSGPGFRSKRGGGISGSCSPIISPCKKGPKAFCPEGAKKVQPIHCPLWMGMIGTRQAFFFFCAARHVHATCTCQTDTLSPARPSSRLADWTKDQRAGWPAREKREKRAPKHRIRLAWLACRSGGLVIHSRTYIHTCMPYVVRTHAMSSMYPVRISSCFFGGRVGTTNQACPRLEV
jgi:hypothetical protein